MTSEALPEGVGVSEGITDIITPPNTIMRGMLRTLKKKLEYFVSNLITRPTKITLHIFQYLGVSPDLEVF